MPPQAILSPPTATEPHDIQDLPRVRRGGIVPGSGQQGWHFAELKSGDGMTASLNVPPRGAARRKVGRRKANIRRRMKVFTTRYLSEQLFASGKLFSRVR